MMKNKETKSPAKSELEKKTSRLGKSQGIPLHFRVKVKRNLSRKQGRNGKPETQLRITM